MKEPNDVNADEAFAEKANKLFAHSVESLDAETRSKLNRSRQAALAEIRSGSRRWVQWGPAGGVAVAAVAALVVWTGGLQVDVLDSPEVASDMEILLTEDSLEMLEDLEFYSWMEFDGEAIEQGEPTNNVG
jgi:ferric-dicitrate binding protein FerR (iron transport regulator)